MFKSINDRDSYLWDVIDLDTRRFIRGVQWADDNIGEYKVIKFNKDGNVKRKNGNVETSVLRGNIKLVKKVRR